MSPTQTLNESKQAEESEIRPAITIAATNPPAPVPPETEAQLSAVNMAQLVPTESIEAVARLFRWAKATQ